MMIAGCLALAGWFLAETGNSALEIRALSEWQELMNRIDLNDPDSRRYVPGLMELIDDPAVPWFTRRQAALTLGRLGALARDAVPRVVRHLDEVCAAAPETSPQRWALSSLALFGREARSAAPQLVELLERESSSLTTRLGCLEALSQIGSAAPEAIPALIRALERRCSSGVVDEDLAVAAAEALGMVGPDAAAAVPSLMRAAQSDSEHLRRETLRALGRIGEAARDAQPLLCDAMLSDDSVVVRDVAMTALGQTGPSAWLLVEPLFTADEAEIRVRAATLVSGWRSALQTVVPALERLFVDPDPHVRLTAIRSWRGLTGRHDHVWSLLVDLLADPDRNVRRGASQELQAAVIAGAVAEAEIARLARDPRPSVQKEGKRLQRLWNSVQKPVSSD